MRAADSGRGVEWSPEDDRECLTWDEVRALTAEGLFRFGSHTESHFKLADLPHAEAEAEMRTSRDAVQAELGNAPLPFAFPYGSYTEALCRSGRKLGYTCALTTDGGANSSDDLFQLCRTLIGNGDDIPAFAMRVSQLAHWLGSVRGA
jgi:peptidoglycan/xylan/chitin deacetylase (PgdA/CDA1 family)